MVNNTSLSFSGTEYLTVLKWATAVMACCIVFSVQLGIQTIPFLLSGELFPSDVRAFCKSMTRCFACMLMVLSLKMFPWLDDELGLSGVFYIFCGVITLCTPVVYFVLPETKGMSLEMVQYYFTPQITRFYVDTPM